MIHRKLIGAVACAVIALSATALLAEETAQPKGQESQSPSPGAEQPAKVSPDAQKLLDEVGVAYSKLHSLDLSGTLTSNVDAAGRKQNESMNFTASFQAPNKFRHAMQNDVLCGSTGAQAYAYLAERNVYRTEPAPSDKVATSELPGPLAAILPAQNPSLMLALAKDPARELASRASELSKGDDVKLGDTSYPALRMQMKDKSVSTVVIDPQTHLVREVINDIKPAAEARGVPDVKSATYTIDYKTSTPDAAVKDEQFAWAPPAGAKDFAKLAADQEQGGEEAAMSLVGKPAPNFKLKGLDDKEVSLSDLKGKVVLLDFWATWCGPCRISLPHIAEIYQAKKKDGLNGFAVNVAEEKAQVQSFVDKTKLNIPVLLDSEGNTGTAYKADAIPETVLIGKDGKVKNVWIGVTAPEKISKAVDAALGEK